MLHYNTSLGRTRPRDLEKELSEEELSLEQFVKAYNKNLPAAFPQVTPQLLDEFQTQHASLFKDQKHWTLGQHRKKVMDWLAQHIDSAELRSR